MLMRFAIGLFIGVFLLSFWGCTQSSVGSDCSVLQQAIGDQNIEKVKNLVESGCRLDTPELTTSEEPLGIGDQDGCKLLALLLIYGLDPNQGVPLKDKNEKTYGRFRQIDTAAALADPRFLSLLLAYGADPNTESAKVRSPLIHAYLHGRPRNANILYGYGADLNIKLDDLTILDFLRLSRQEISEESYLELISLAAISNDHRKRLLSSSYLRECQDGDRTRLVSSILKWRELEGREN